MDGFLYFNMKKYKFYIILDKYKDKIDLFCKEYCIDKDIFLEFLYYNRYIYLLFMKYKFNYKLFSRKELEECLIILKK